MNKKIEEKNEDQEQENLALEGVVKFMSKRHFATIFSALLIVVSVASLFVNGLKFGLDFTGGTQIVLQYEQTADLNQIRGDLAALGYEGAEVKNFGSDRDVQIKIQTSDAKLGDQVATALRTDAKENVELLSVEYVGPQIGEELRDEGGLGMLFALAVVMVYVALRFQFKFSVGAVVALAHDVIIVLGLFSLLQLDFDLTVLAAVLAVIGYSLNDTIVVADRIRENFRKVRKGTATDIINISLTQTIGRTLVTSLTTLLVLIALSILGGEVIHNFATALITGVVIGTYSSIYVAANILLAMHISKEDLIVIEKEGEDLEEIMP